MKKEIAFIGLGKMGGNIARRLKDKKWKVRGYDVSKELRGELASEGVKTFDTLRELVESLPRPRVVWLMVSVKAADKKSRAPIDDVLFAKNGLIELLEKGDVVIDGGNSYFEETIVRAKKVARHGVKFLDVGFSGGPAGARNGGCLMVGGDTATFKKFEPLFRDLSLDRGYQFFKGVGAGHFVKMVHNGIEYGMMQAIAEGFALMKKSTYKLNLKDVAHIYNRGSVIESRLVGWLGSAFLQHGEDLLAMSGTVGHLGEGEWTVKTAKKMNAPLKIIEESFKFRLQSVKNPSYQGRILSALREQFGGKRTKTS